MTIESCTNTCAKPDTQSNPNHDPKPDPTTKQHTIVNIPIRNQWNSYEAYVAAPFVPTSIVIGTLSFKRLTLH